MATITFVTRMLTKWFEDGIWSSSGLQEVILNETQLIYNVKEDVNIDEVKATLSQFRVSQMGCEQAAD